MHQSFASTAHPPSFENKTEGDSAVEPGRQAPTARSQARDIQGHAQLEKF